MSNVAPPPRAGKAAGSNGACTGPAGAWKAHSAPLAAWALAHLVNRLDAWGGYYTDKAGGVLQTTRKADDPKRPGGPLTAEVLQYHFMGKGTDFIVGLHTTWRDDAGACWCRWLVVDIDRHGEAGDPDANLAAALAWYELAVSLGFSALLFDSNGAGGFHLWILFSEPVPTADVFALGRWLVRDWKTRGVGEPEVFPKQPGIPAGKFGNWCRLPGRHHKRDHYTRVWGGSEWLEGSGAVRRIVETRGASPAAIPDEARVWAAPKAKPKPAAKAKPWTVEVPQKWDDATLAAAALQHLTGDWLDDYDDWLQVGFSLRSLGAVGLALWDHWSQGDPKYEAGVCREKWDTMEDQGVGLGSLFHWATCAGWVNPTARTAATPPPPPPRNEDKRDDRDNSPPDDPPPAAAGAEPPAVYLFANFTEVDIPGEDGKPKRVRVPLRIGEIADGLAEITRGWPKRVGPMLFVEGADGKPHWLDSAPKLFAWVDRRAKVVWTRGAAFITQERFYEDLKVSAENFDGIEIGPHFPPMPRTYYMHPPVGPPGRKLEGLLDRFNPASPVDRQLIKAMIFTPFWGGLPGRRPAFVITGPDRDSENGRGLGKSTLAEIVAQELGGGLVEVPPTGDMEAVKTRLLSPGAAYTRFARLDNVKTLRFSWAELECLITASVVSGKRLYQGEGTRPNTLVWVITVNGESLSEDLAQRCIHVKLKRPQYRDDWEAEVRRYVRDNLAGLWGDVRHALEHPAAVEVTGRWADWEAGVLAATDDPATTQWDLIDRRKAMNADRREADDFRCYLGARLAELDYEPDTCCVFIPSEVLAEWLDRAERKRFATNQASARVRGFGILELTKSDSGVRRGWTWRGCKCPHRDAPGADDVITKERAFPDPRDGGRRWGTVG